MTFECSLSFDGPPPLDAIVTRLSDRGLLALELRPDGALLAYANTPEEQVKRWGGDVEISVVQHGLFIAIAGSGPRSILADILDELAARGLSVAVDEP